MGIRFCARVPVVGLVAISSVLGAAACAAEGGLVDDDAGVIHYAPSDATAAKDARADARAWVDAAATDEDAGTEQDASVGDSGKPVDGGAKDAGDAGDAGDGGTTVSCKATNACSSATSLGSISGDTGKALVTKTGYLSTWFKIEVTEDDSSWLSAHDLSAQFALGSPVGSNYDLYVYDGCSTLLNQSTNLTGTDSVNASWVDQRPAHDDAKTLYVYVKHQGGDCKVSSPWSLQVRGNYP
jgi:hypothetical protein